MDTWISLTSVALLGYSGVGTCSAAKYGFEGIMGIMGIAIAIGMAGGIGGGCGSIKMPLR